MRPFLCAKLGFIGEKLVKKNMGAFLKNCPHTPKKLNQLRGKTSRKLYYAARIISAKYKQIVARQTNTP